MNAREAIAADRILNEIRCEGCLQVGDGVVLHELPGGIVFRLCRDCAELHSAVPVREGT